VRLFLFFPLPGVGSPGWPVAVAGRAGPGLDGAGGAERPSTRTHGRAAPGNANRSRPAPATPAEGPGTADDPLLTIDEVIAELRVSRAAFYRWRRQGAGPAVVRLPGGGVRVRRSALSAWLRRLEGSTAEGQE
jgi:excisionase family DNA binding protein